MTAMRWSRVAGGRWNRFAGGLWAAALMVVATGFRAQAAPADPREPELGFVAVGGESGLGLSEVLARLVAARVVRLRPEIVTGTQAPIAAVRASYGLPEWVDLSELMTALCDYNKGVCSRVRGQPAWKIRAAEKAQVAADACEKVLQQGSAPANVMCIPDVGMTMGRTFLTRMIGRDEGRMLPGIVTGLTKGCTTFDPVCQRLILSRNSVQSTAWSAAQSAGLYAADETGRAISWWRELSGRVVLPAAMITAILREGAASGPEGPAARCGAVVDAVLAADAAIRAKRHIAGDYSYIVATDCETVLANHNARSARARQLQGRVVVSPGFRDALIAEFRKAMNLRTLGGSPAGYPLIGVWDGRVENRLSLLRGSGYAKLTNNRATTSGSQRLLEGTVVSWMDPFPQDVLGDPPGGPCGAVDLSSGRDADHGTIVASMISGEVEGLLPGARLWAHQWDKRRYTLGKKVGPQDSLDWFNENVLEARLLGKPPHIVNLSCGVDYDPQTEADAWQSLTAHLNGLNNLEVAPYLGAVAAGNRAEASDPLNVAAPEQDPLKVAVGGGGYPFLARQYATSGFISVVGLSPSGENVLQCRDIQAVLAKAKAAGAQVAETNVTGFCPVGGDTNPDSSRAPLVVSGSVFDVGAVGIGVGITGADADPVVMWGSSFAAPYVTGLAAQIVQKFGSLIPTGAAQANAVADRIRLTTDRMSTPNIVRYGRINGVRALAFETDQFEFNPLPDDPSERRLDAKFAYQCSADGGRIELDRDKSRRLMLPLANGSTIKLDEALRIRGADQDGGYEVIYRAPNARFGPSLAIATVANGSITLPVQCVGPPGKPQLRTPIQLDVVRSFTRCSFGVDQCK